MGPALAVDRTVAVLAYTLVGVGLGTLSGLVPGLHANAMALLLASVAPTLPGPPLLVGCAMLGAGVVHTFLDVVPALTLGVPDPAMAASALPGHRLVLEGRGYEALRLSALGSVMAVLLAVPLALPITRAMERLWPLLSTHLGLVLGGVALALVVTEPTYRGALGGAGALVASALLGFLTLDLPLSPLVPVGSVLAPLFAGLFGAPVLLDAMGGSGVPPQDDPVLGLSRRAVGGFGTVGTVCGAVVGYVPGVSAAVAATLALVVLPARTGARGFVVTTSGVNTATAVFALFALVALGSPRTGVLVAVEEAGVPLDIPVLLSAVAIAAVCGFALVVVVGDRYLATLGRVEPTVLSVTVLGVLVVLSVLFAGPVGVGVFAAATVVGMLPVWVGARRVHLMGVLLGPLALG